ncbi:MAG: phosphoribosylamine--glycine ligase [Parcubacteria group bacterium Gr01-1014_30]|nr:MAG: phosphoribosylamine--glycine ligase [Parcubacteria group bacterium Gr01-1014_30]
MKALVVGSGGREEALVRTLLHSRYRPEVFCLGPWKNPGITEQAADLRVGNITNPAEVVGYAKEVTAKLAVVGPEAPLEAGVADALLEAGIPTVGPEKELAQIETSKSFCRNLLAEYHIDASPKHRYFSSLEGVKEWVEELQGNYAVKADGLMGGKGVKLSGAHLKDVKEALAWCREILQVGRGFLVEERLSGPEFSLMSFSDGQNLAHMPLVKDHKRLLEGDKGPQTGGMGSYSDVNHKLPFLTDQDIARAREINEETVTALKKKFNKKYRGILYGGFMKTKDGVRLIEYNARFGDPEAINVLALLESDFLELCFAIVEGRLSQDKAIFAKKATVCKYAVPEGHPDNPVKDAVITPPPEADMSRLYFAGVEEKRGKWYCTGSRAVAALGIADTIGEAEKISEAEIQKVKGPLYHRSDIGKVL